MKRCLTLSRKLSKRTFFGMGIACLYSSSAWALPVTIEEPPTIAIVQDGQQKGQSSKITVIVRDDKEVVEDQSDDEKSSDKKITAQVDVQAGPAPKIWLGLTLESIDGGLARYLGHDHGVVIHSVYPDSPAEKAELKEGDIIIAFNGQEVKNSDALLDGLRKLSDRDAIAIESAKSPAGEIEIKVLRRGETKSLKIVPVARPESVKQPRSIEINSPELKQMAVGGGSIFKFGNPVVVPGLNLGKGKTNISLVQINEDGKTTEVKIESTDDQPPKITLTDDEGSREIAADQLDKLPAKLRRAVQEALDRKPQSPSESHEAAAKQAEKAEAAAAAAREAVELRIQKWEEARKKFEGKVNGKAIEKNVEAEKAAAKAAEKAASLEAQIREQVEQALKQFPKGNGVVVISPEWAQDMQKSAEKMAQEGMKKAGQFAAMPDKIAELQDKIDKLQKQVEELTKKLEERAKADSKQ